MPGYVTKNRINRLRTNRQFAKPIRIGPKPIRARQQTKQPNITKTLVTKESIEQHKKSLRRQISKSQKPIIKQKQFIPIKPKITRSNGIVGAVRTNQPNKRIGRGDIRHSIRSAQHQKVLRIHANKINEMRWYGREKILVMLACGPSINEVDFSPLLNNPNIHIMCINKPNKQVWPSTHWSFCDLSQYNRNKDAWETYDGIIWNSQSIRVPHKKQIMIRNRSGQGFSRNLTEGYYICRTTTYASMQIANWLGYERIYIFGCDMCAVNGQTHFYGRNPDVDDTNRVQRFVKEAEGYNFAAATLTEPERKKFYFCSSYNKFPFTEKFNKMDHKTAIPSILEFAKNKLAI